MVSRGSLHRPNPESKVQPPDMLSVIIKWFRRCRPRCRKMAKQMAQGEGGGSRRCKLSQREARLESGKNESAMLKRIHAKESRHRVGRKERLTLSLLVDEAELTQASALRPSEVLGLDMAVDSSTMRLNSCTTSGEILSQSRLRV